MKRSFVRWLGMAGVVALFAGCSGEAPEIPKRTKTGAEDTAQEFFTAVINKEWKAAYRKLGPDSKTSCSAEQFKKRGEAYCVNLGFDPSSVQVVSCDETGDTAIAHVAIKGIQGSSMQFRKDAVALNRDDAGWTITLPTDFGKKYSKN